MSTKRLFVAVLTCIAEEFRAEVKSNNLTNSFVFTQYLNELTAEEDLGAGSLAQLHQKFYGFLKKHQMDMRGAAAVSSISANVDADTFDEFFSNLSYKGYSYSISDIVRLFIFRFLEECECACIKDYFEINVSSTIENMQIDEGMLPYDVCIKAIECVNSLAG